MLKPAYVKCVYDCGDSFSRFTVNKIYKNQDFSLEFLYLKSDRVEPISHLYDYPLDGHNWKFITATEEEYNLQENIVSKVKQKENLDYLISFLTSNNIT